MNSQGACFSPYLLISSGLQAVFNADRRAEMESATEEGQAFAIEMRAAKEEFQDELEREKAAALRTKITVARQYRAKEKQESLKLQDMSVELRAFFDHCLPIDTTVVPVVLKIANDYRERGFCSECDLNIVLLRTKQKYIDYEEISDELEKVQHQIGNVSFRRWCNQDSSRNGAFLNLHALMSGIPSLIISPYIQGGMIHFSASLWDAQSGQKPLIRPLFSLPCEVKSLTSPEGRQLIQEQISIATALISGCARDSYMLLSYGKIPTLPHLLSQHPGMVSKLKEPKYQTLLKFVVTEVNSMAKSLALANTTSGIISEDEKQLLLKLADNASLQLSKTLA